MPNPDPATPTGAAPPAQTHQQAAELLRRPFAPGAIGFRAMTKVTLDGEPYAGAQVAAFLNAQSVVQRLNAIVPGRWRQEFRPAPAELVPAGSKRIYLACRLILALPVEDGGADVEAVYEDVGEMDSGSLAGLKALYSDARKRAAVAAGIGAYLYTALAPVVLAIGPHPRQVQCIRRQGKSDLLVLSAETEQWLRHGYQARMSTDAVRRDLGEILAHGEPEPAWAKAKPPTSTPPSRRATPTATPRPPSAPRPTRPPQTATASSPWTSADSGPPRRTPRDLMSPARERLAAQSAAAGYPTALLITVAEATLPHHRAGERLDDRQIDDITAALETHAMPASAPSGCQRSSPTTGTAWREPFWAHVLRTANARTTHPERHGFSPHETDPTRLAQHPPRPATPGRAI